MPEATDQALDGFPRWDSLLSSFESELQSAQNLDHDAYEAPALGPWAAPQEMIPLPAHFAARADRILRAQRQALTALGQAKNDAAKHLAALEAIPSVRPSQQSVYLDVEG